MIANAMGGRIAEELFIGRITTGASNDIEKATELARSMVCQYGMSDLGPLAFGKKDEQIFLGEDIDFYWRLTRYAKKNGGTLNFIEEPAVTTSTRRFDEMSLWDTMVLTHPIYILINWRRSKPWKKWYDGSVR